MRVLFIAITLGAGGILALNPASASSLSSQAQPIKLRQDFQAPPNAKPSATYTIRAQITELPEADKPQTELKLRHEAIDSFANRDGKVIGMSAMTMEFPPAKGLSLAGLKVGDKVAVTFSLWWDQAPPWLATAITKLPDDTKLEYRKAKKPGSDEPKPTVPAQLPMQVRESFEKLFGKELISFSATPAPSVGTLVLWSLHAERPARPQGPADFTAPGPAAASPTAVSALITDSGTVLTWGEALTDLPAELSAAMKAALSEELKGEGQLLIALSKPTISNGSEYAATASVGKRRFRVAISVSKGVEVKLIDAEPIK